MRSSSPPKGKILLVPVQDSITLKLIGGPLIGKTNVGPGRLLKEAESIGRRPSYTN